MLGLGYSSIWATVAIPYNFPTEVGVRAKKSLPPPIGSFRRCSHASGRLISILGLDSDHTADPWRQSSPLIIAGPRGSSRHWPCYKGLPTGTRAASGHTWETAGTGCVGVGDSAEGPGASLRPPGRHPDRREPICLPRACAMANTTSVVGF